jgi:hypothetical protein
MPPLAPNAFQTRSVVIFSFILIPFFVFFLGLWAKAKTFVFLFKTKKALRSIKPI